MIDKIPVTKIPVNTPQGVQYMEGYTADVATLARKLNEVIDKINELSMEPESKIIEVKYEEIKD